MPWTSTGTARGDPRHRSCERDGCVVRPEEERGHVPGSGGWDPLLLRRSPDWKGKPVLVGQYQGIDSPFEGKIVTLLWDGKRFAEGGNIHPGYEHPTAVVGDAWTLLGKFGQGVAADLHGRESPPPDAGRPGEKPVQIVPIRTERPRNHLSSGAAIDPDRGPKEACSSLRRRCAWPRGGGGPRDPHLRKSTRCGERRPNSPGDFAPGSPPMGERGIHGEGGHQDGSPRFLTRGPISSPCPFERGGRSSTSVIEQEGRRVQEKDQPAAAVPGGMTDKTGSASAKSHGKTGRCRGDGIQDGKKQGFQRRSGGIGPPVDRQGHEDRSRREEVVAGEGRG